MANTLRFKRGLLAGLPSAAVGEPLFTTDTFDLYIGTASGTQKYQKFIASGTTSQLLRGDGSLLTMPIVLSSPANGEVLKYNGTNWVNSSDAGVTGSGVSGQVTYWNGTGTVTGNAGLLFNGTNRLTIDGGTTGYLVGPTGEMLIGEDAGGVYIGYGFGVSPAIPINYGSTGTTSHIWRANGSERMRLHSTGNLVLGGTVSTDNGLRFQVTGDGYFSGSVGIGITTPTYLIDAYGTTSSRIRIQGTTNFTLFQSQNNGGIFYIGTDSSTASGFGAGNYSRVVWSDGAYPIVFATNNTERMRLDASGNLGLGTTSPAGRLEVNGLTFINNTADTTARLLLRNSTTGASAGGLDIREIGVDTSINNASNGNMYFSTNNSERVRIFAGGNVSIGSTSDNGLRFQVTGNGFFSGSVGIGTSTISEKLHLVGGNARFDSSNINVVAKDTGTGYSVFVAIGQNASGAILDSGVHGATANSIMTGAPANAGIIGTRTNHQLHFGTNSTSRMMLDASGNLGLGVTPSAWNSKSRSFELSQTNRAGWVLEHFRSSDATAGNAANIGVGFYRGTADDTLRYINSFTKPQIFGCFDGAFSWYQAAAGTAGNTITLTEAMKLDASGNLGIGTTNPLDRLHVNNGDFFFGNESNVIQNIRFRRNAATVGSIGTYGNQIEINGGSTLGAGHLAITSGGSVILGFTGSSTGEKLQVNGTMRVSGASTFNNFITVTRNQDANVTTFNATAGVTPVSAFVINTDQPNLRSILMARNGYSLVLGTQDVNRVTIDTTGAATFSSSVTAGARYIVSAASSAGISDISYGSLSGGAWINTPSATNGYLAVAGNAALRWSASELNFYVSAAEAMRLDANGFGIGGVPAQKLDVQGSANSIQARFGNVAGRGLTIGTSAISGTNDAGVVFNAPTATDGTLVFQTTSVERARISGSGNLLINTTSDTGYKLRVNGTSYFDDNLRFPNLKGCVFVQTGGSLLGSIAMDSANAVTIDNNGFAGLSVGGSYTMTGGNLGIGHSAFGTSATKTISVNSGTAPSTSPTDAFQLYSADITAGNAAPHFRTENGGIIKLYQQTTGVTSATYIGGAGTGLTDSDTFDGYTIAQIVKALRNAGLLA